MRIWSVKGLGVAGEGIDERESGKFEEGLNSKVKLSLYRTFGKIVEFKKYLRGVGDAGTRLLFKFRSGTHGLNEELGRHRGREGRKECLLCDAECESVSHVLWDCPAYVSIRSAFMLELRRELGDRFEHFQSLDSFEKSSYVLGSEAWEEYSSGLLGLIKDFVLSVWEERKVRLYGEHANVHQSHSQNDSGDLRGVAGGNGELGCLCGKAGTSHLCDGSAHSSGCVVNGYGCRLSYYYNLYVKFFVCAHTGSVWEMCVVCCAEFDRQRRCPGKRELLSRNGISHTLTHSLTLLDHHTSFQLMPTRHTLTVFVVCVR